MMDKRPWINVDIEQVLVNIRELQIKQGGGVGWTDDDANRLEALERTAARLREQNAPLSEQVSAAHRQVSNVNPVNIKAALNGITTAAPLPEQVRKNILENS